MELKMQSFDFLQVCELLSEANPLNMSAEELACKFGCRPSQLSRLLQDHFGYSFAALTLELRLLKATRLLKEPSVAIGSVAKQCGFGHPGLFAACFQRRFGATPAKWREQGPERAHAILVDPAIASLLDRMPAEFGNGSGTAPGRCNGEYVQQSWSSLP